MVIADLVDTLSRVGAIGGILAIIGVGLLILLVAAQNRQIRSMREWIDEEPQRQEELTRRVIAEVQRRISAARERRAAAAGTPVVPPLPSRPLPAAPGTLGATPEAQKIAASKELVPPATMPAETAAAAAVAADGTEPPAFAPLTPAGGADVPEVPAPPPLEDDAEPAVVAEFLSQETQVADALPDHEPVAAAAPADVRFGDEQFDLEHEEPRGGSRVLFGVGVVALLAGIVLAGVILFGGGSDEPKAETPPAEQVTPADEGAATPSTPGSAAVDPGTVNVRVLNGTTISGLAQRVTDDLKTQGYVADEPITFSGAQTVSETSVEYRPGQEEEAKAVAEALGLPASSVKPIDADLSVAAGQTAEVVVLTGTDLDSTSGTTGE